MQTTKTILTATGLSYTEYDAWRFDQYIAWCYHIGKTYYFPAKLLIKHDGVFNWYCDMWLQHVERQFILDNQNLLTLNDHEGVQLLLMTYPDDLRDMSPQSLLDLIRTQKTAKKEYESQ